VPKNERSLWRSEVLVLSPKPSAQMTLPLASPSPSKCLRRTPSRQWLHPEQYRDNRTVACMCGCAECIEHLSVVDHDYKKRKKHNVKE